MTRRRRGRPRRRRCPRKKDMSRSSRLCIITLKMAALRPHASITKMIFPWKKRCTPDCPPLDARPKECGLPIEKTCLNPTKPRPSSSKPWRKPSWLLPSPLLLRGSTTWPERISRLKGLLSGFFKNKICLSETWSRRRESRSESTCLLNLRKNLSRSCKKT